MGSRGQRRDGPCGEARISLISSALRRKAVPTVHSHSGIPAVNVKVIGYDTPDNFRKRYYDNEVPHKESFKDRVLSSEPKFVQKRRQKTKKTKT